MASKEFSKKRGGKPQVLTWHPGSYTIQYVLRNFQLPQVVQCDHSVCGVTGQESKEDRKRQQQIQETVRDACAVPVLLHSVRESSIVCGVCLKPVERNWVETDTKISIPINYKGYFAVYSSKPKAGDIQVMHEVSELAAVDRFFVAGKESLRVKLLQGGVYKWASLLPGAFITVMGTHTDQHSFLRGMDQHRNELLIPLSHPGRFYVIPKKKKKKLAFAHIGAIVSKLTLPCYIRLLWGPRRLKHFEHFTAYIKVTSVKQGPLVVGSTVTIAASNLTEICKYSPLKFKIATLNAGWLDYPGFKKAASTIVDNIEDYNFNISVFPKTRQDTLLHFNKIKPKAIVGIPNDKSKTVTREQTPTPITSSSAMRPTRQTHSSVVHRTQPDQPSADVRKHEIPETTSSVHEPKPALLEINKEREDINAYETMWSSTTTEQDLDEDLDSWSVDFNDNDTVWSSIYKCNPPSRDHSYTNVPRPCLENPSQISPFPHTGKSIDHRMVNVNLNEQQHGIDVDIVTYNNNDDGGDDVSVDGLEGEGDDSFHDYINVVVGRTPDYANLKDYVHDYVNVPDGTVTCTDEHVTCTDELVNFTDESIHDYINVADITLDATDTARSSRYACKPPSSDHSHQTVPRPCH